MCRKVCFDIYENSYLDKLSSLFKDSIQWSDAVADVKQYRFNKINNIVSILVSYFLMKSTILLIILLML